MTSPAGSLIRAEAYFGAWNAHDPDAVSAAFTKGGTYVDPTVSGSPLCGSALAEHARALFIGFPDVRFEVLGIQPENGGADGAVAARWQMRGTNTGPLGRMAPTGRLVALRGVDVITFTCGKIGSVEGFFDRQTRAEQLGLQMRPVPPTAGPFQFGYAVRLTSGSTAIPGVVSLTWIDVRSEQEAERVRLLAAAVAKELSSEPGFVGYLGVEIANRLYTITAWETPDAARSLLRSRAHKYAVRGVSSEDLGLAAATGIRGVHHLNPVRVRCSSCAQMTDAGSSDRTCACGQPLPESPPYW
jgi:predicted ester cyclase